MSTSFVGMKEFRQNFSSYATKLKKKNTRLVILKKNKPVLEVRGIDERAASLEQLTRDIAEARQDVKKGRVYTTEQVRKNLGL